MEAPQENGDDGLLEGIEKDGPRKRGEKCGKPQRPGGGGQGKKSAPASQAHQSAGPRGKKQPRAARKARGAEIAQELAKAVVHEIVAHMPPHPLSGSPRQRERGGAHRQLGLGAPQGDAGRLPAVVGTAFLIHAAVDGIVRKRPVHGADRFQHALPGRAADRAQGGDGVADPQAAFGLVGMLACARSSADRPCWSK